MAVEELVGTQSRAWGEYRAEEWSDAVVAAMKLGGIDNLFFVSGSEIAFYQESIARARQWGTPAPRLVTVTHESVALNAALGSAMVSGEPAASAVHVDVGTFNYGGALHTAWRGGYPVLITAGTGPRAYPGTMTGGRNSAVQWVQEPRDQGEIVRQYMKLDHRLEHQDNPGLMISRLLQVAMSEPKGPVYMSLPRESAMLPMPGTTRFPTRDQLGLARPVWPDPSDARKVAEWLIHANNPVLVSGKSGRNPESVAEVVRLAELLAIPVSPGRGDRLSFPTTHPLYGTGPQPKNADVVLVIESPVPWMPPEGAPSDDAKIVWIDVDPVQARYKTMEWSADLWLAADAGCTARAIYDAATSMLTQSDLSRIEERRARLQQRKQEQEAATEERGQRAGRRHPLSPQWVAYQLGKVLEPNSILLDDALSNSGAVQDFAGRSEPSSYFRSGGSSGGWGAGAALGAKFAAPDRDVALATGDGYFMFGTPMPALWCSAHYKMPYLTVVFVNRSYSTGTNGLKATYPEGAAMEANNFEGGIFDPPPDFAKLAEAANGYGETVREPEEVAPALARALDQIHRGTPALIAAMLPTLVEEMTL